MGQLHQKHIVQLAWVNEQAKSFEGMEKKVVIVTHHY